MPTETIAMVPYDFVHLPEQVHWRSAAGAIARCLGDKNIAVRMASSDRDECSVTEYWTMWELFYSRPFPRPVRDIDGEPECLCRVPLWLDRPASSLSELATIDPAEVAKRSPADIGFTEQDPPGCVGFWLTMVGYFAFGPRKPKKRPGRSGRPNSPLDLRGGLRSLVRLVELARDQLQDKDVVSPEVCVALMLWFDTFSNGSQNAEPALAHVVECERGVATGKSLWALAKSVHDLRRKRLNGD